MKIFDIAYHPQKKLWFVIEHIGDNNWKTRVGFDTEELAIQFKALLSK